jgi:hypothetical protein
MTRQFTMGWLGTTGHTYTVGYGDTSGGEVTVITGITSNSVVFFVTGTSAYTGYVETNCVCSTPRQYFNTGEASDTTYYPYLATEWEVPCVDNHLPVNERYIYGNSSSWSTCTQFYDDSGATTVLNGMYLWWRTSGNKKSIKINSTGSIILTTMCP